MNVSLSRIDVILPTDRIVWPAVCGVNPSPGQLTRREQAVFGERPTVPRMKERSMRTLWATETPTVDTEAWADRLARDLGVSELMAGLPVGGAIATRRGYLRAILRLPVREAIDRAAADPRHATRLQGEKVYEILLERIVLKAVDRLDRTPEPVVYRRSA